MVLISIVLAYVALAAALTAVLAMLARLSGAAAGKGGAALLWVHRVAGYVFLAIMIFLFAGMLYKITAYGNVLSARVAWHGAAGFAVVAFLFLKWAVVRPYRGLMKFAPPLGMTVFGLAFVVIMLGATTKLLARLGAGEPAGPPVVEVIPGEEMVERHEEMMELMRPAVGEADRLHAARFVFAEKCGKCHHLRRPLAKPRTEADWPPLLERMRSYDRSWISDVDAEEIELYLVNDYGPGR
ncbi:MAG TPA: hypothetical protein VMX79_05570 [bacterium]|nr:hypothetical protein [bacterium]